MRLIETLPTWELFLLCSRSKKEAKRKSAHYEMLCSFPGPSARSSGVRTVCCFVWPHLCGSEQPKQLPKQASVVPSCAQDGPDVPDFLSRFQQRAKKKGKSFFFLPAHSAQHAASHPRPPLAGRGMLLSFLPPLSHSHPVCIPSLIN